MIDNYERKNNYKIFFTSFSSSISTFCYNSWVRSCRRRKGTLRRRAVSGKKKATDNDPHKIALFLSPLSKPVRRIQRYRTVRPRSSKSIVNCSEIRRVGTIDEQTNRLLEVCSDLLTENGSLSLSLSLSPPIFSGGWNPYSDFISFSVFPSSFFFPRDCLDSKNSENVSEIEDINFSPRRGRLPFSANLITNNIIVQKIIDRRI